MQAEQITAVFTVNWGRQLKVEAPRPLNYSRLDTVKYLFNDTMKRAKAEARLSITRMLYSTHKILKLHPEVLDNLLSECQYM